MPGEIEVRDCRFEILDTRFVTELDGLLRRFEETEPDEYRGMVMTVRITKPAGHKLTFHAADIALHYYYSSDDYDVAPCQGISLFSTTRAADRQMRLSRGWLEISTSDRTTEARTVYCDLFFQNMESGTSDCWLTIAQPVGAYYRSRGW
jgi:hypothetical protein